MKFITKVTQDESGQGLTEYLILVFLIAIITLGTVKAIGSTLNTKFQTVKRHINEKVVLKD